MVDPDQFIECIITPSLKAIGLYSEPAAQLLLGTACAESKLGTYVKQIRGPALGVYQMEPRTHDDLWTSYIYFRTKLLHDLERMIPDDDSMTYPPASTLLIHDLRYATIMARLLYRRHPMPLPQAGDWEGMASMWKVVYNTHLGKGTTEHFLRSLQSCGVI